MGFINAKQQLFNCNDTSNAQHEIRHDIDLKSLPYSGAVSVVDVKAAVVAANDNDYECNRHHQMKSIDAHIIYVTR